MELVADMNSVIAEIPRVPTRAQIVALEDELRKLPQIDITTTHHFSDGLYAREIFIPAGTLLTGKAHLRDHLNFLTKGRIAVWTEDGMKELTAPQIIPSFAGTKRVGYAMEDTIWVTVHATKNTDLNEIEAELIEPDLSLLEAQPCLG